MRRFVVVVNTGTTEQHKKFIAYLKSTGANWWHWLASAFLVIDKKNKETAASLRDAACDCYPTQNVLVLEIPPGDTWAGFGPSSATKNMFKWIKDHWDASD